MSEFKQNMGDIINSDVTGSNNIFSSIDNEHNKIQNDMGLKIQEYVKHFTLLNSTLIGILVGLSYKDNQSHSLLFIYAIIFLMISLFINVCLLFYLLYIVENKNNQEFASEVVKHIINQGKNKISYGKDVYNNTIIFSVISLCLFFTSLVLLLIDIINN